MVIMAEACHVTSNTVLFNESALKALQALAVILLVEPNTQPTQHCGLNQDLEEKNDDVLAPMRIILAVLLSPHLVSTSYQRMHPRYSKPDTSSITPPETQEGEPRAVCRNHLVSLS